MRETSKRADEVQVGDRIRDDEYPTHSEVVARDDDRGIVFLHLVAEGNRYPYLPGETVRVADRCYTCDATGKAARGWAGQYSTDGTCPDCRGTGIDMTTYGTGSDHCPHCGSDWRQQHFDGCVVVG